MHQSCLSMLAMAAFSNALGPDVLKVLGGIPGAGKHSSVAATQEAAALTTAAARLPVSSETIGEAHIHEKTDTAEDYTHIYISSGTEVVEMASTTLYYPLQLRDAGVATTTSVAAAASSQAAADALGALPLGSLPLGGLKRDSSSAIGASGGSGGPSAEWAPVEEEAPQGEEPVEATFTTLLASSTAASARAVGTSAAANPLGSLPVLGGLGGGLPVKRDSSSAVGASGGDGDSPAEWAPVEEVPEEEPSFERSSSTFTQRSTSSTALVVSTPAAANPLGSLPVLGALAGGLPVKRDSSSATDASGGEGERAPVEEQKDEEPTFDKTSSSTFAQSSTSSTALVVGTPAANPLSSLPVLGALAGGLQVKRDSSSATGAGGGSESEWAATEESLPVEKVPADTTFRTAIRSSTTSSALVGTSAAANPLGSLPILGALGGLKERQLPDAAALEDLISQAASTSAQQAVASATQKANAAVTSATQKAIAAAATATKKATGPLQGLPVLGGLGGI